MDTNTLLEAIHQDYKTLTSFLVKNKITITTMESCTSGFIASLITDTEGSSAVFTGSCVTYSNKAKILNGVDEEILLKYGVYSVETATAMAKAALKRYPSNIGIGITGSFGNVDPNNKDSIPGKVFIAVQIELKLHTKELSLPTNISRFDSKLYVAKEIFEIINENLLTQNQRF